MMLGASLIRSTCQCPPATDMTSGKSIGMSTPLAVCMTARTVTSMPSALGGTSWALARSELVCTRSMAIVVNRGGCAAVKPDPAATYGARSPCPVNIALRNPETVL